MLERTLPRAASGSYRGLLPPGPGVYAKNVLANVPNWLRRHPRLGDGLLVAALLTFSGAQIAHSTATPTTHIALAAVTALLAAAVAARRRYPVAAFGAAAAIGAAQVAFGMQDGGPGPVVALQPTIADLAIPMVLYTLAAHRPRPVSIAGLITCLLGAVAAIARWSPSHGAYAGGAVLVASAGLGGVTLTAWALGDSVAYRYRRAYHAVLEERAARLEAERDAQARIAAAAERARELQERRAVAVDQSAARLRRIERDLHDGTQVRLAALAMMLGEIKENLEQAHGADDDGQVRMLVSAAHCNAKETLAELRELARGIHPPVLDRGLSAALCALADTVPLPVEVDVRTGERPSAAIEAIAYFCAAELLANMTKHSGANRAAISVSDDGGGVLMTVRDDGVGGAWLAPGGGLAGLRERVRTVDGRLSIDSPSGGPTSIVIDLPGRA